MSKNKNISIILAPFGIGGPNDAAKGGPDALMKCGLKKDLLELGFNVKVVKPSRDVMHYVSTHKQIKTRNRVKNIDALLKANSWLAKSVASELEKGFIPLTLGGDHSLAIGTIAGVCDVLDNVGVLWVDRHFDAHHPAVTKTWRAHGMPAAVAVAKPDFDPHPDFQRFLRIGKSTKFPKVKPENFVHFGIGEKSFTKPKTKWFLMEDINNVGIKKTVDSAIDYLLKRVKHIYIAWDIDALSVTGTGTHADDQLTLREGLVLARAINNKLFQKGKLAGFEMMEVAPRLERKALKGQTVNWASQLIVTSFGGNLFNNYSRLTANLDIHAEP